MTFTVVHLVRHGEVHNPEGLLYGREPGFWLSPKGVVQAQAMADSFADRDIAHIRVSPLERARQTALPLVTTNYAWNEYFRAVPLEIDERVMESDNLFSGMRLSPNATGLVKRPALWKRLYNPFGPSWGESYDGMVQRVMSAVEASRKAAEGREAIIISHQLPIWSTRLFLEGRPQFHDPATRQCGVCSVTSLTFKRDKVIEVAYSEPAAHVEVSS